MLIATQARDVWLVDKGAPAMSDAITLGFEVLRAKRLYGCQADIAMTERQAGGSYIDDA